MLLSKTVRVFYEFLIFTMVATWVIPLRSLMKPLKLIQSKGCVKTLQNMQIYCVQLYSTKQLAIYISNYRFYCNLSTAIHNLPSA